MVKNKICLLGVFILFINVVIAQNKPVLYGFAELPQTLLLNPGAETNYRFHVGVPLASGISANIGSSGVKLDDLFLKDNIDFNIKFAKVLSSLSENDDISFNSQIEILNGGYRLNNNTYLTIGFYEEIDFISYFPKDIVTLLYEGSEPYLNRSFSLSQLVFKMDVLGVLHFGVSRVINRKLTVGGRFKIYSSSINMKSNNNSGTFTTVLGDNNIYTHYLSNMNIAIETSGLSSANNTNFDSSNLISDTFFGGDLGMGIDVGFTYKPNDQVEFTGSILDVGFISHSKNNKTYTINGSYVFEGINFQYDPLNPRDYWAELDADFSSKVDKKTTTDSYISWRSAKVNTSLKYSFGRVRLNKECYDASYKEYFNNSIGMHLFTSFRPLRPQIAFTGFYEKSFSEKFFTKLTYTIDNYSSTNVGAGISFQIGKVNFYGILDNLFKLQDINTANNVSMQFGFNLLFN